MERLVKFEILGQDFSFHTDAPEEDIQEILDLIKSQVEMHSKTSSLIPAKLAVLVSLNVAGKYVKLKKEFEDHKQKVNQNIDSLVVQIEDFM